jgi:hypothetical protein
MPVIKIEGRPFIKIADPETIIWRYMQFHKFTSLLLSQTLFFCRIDKFENDSWEGLFTEKMFDRNRLIEAFRKKGESLEGAAIKADRDIRDLIAIQSHRDEMAVSCWHMNKFESDAFWRIYSRMDEGVAIQSTVKRLEESLHAQDRRNVVTSKITYLDYKNDVFSPGNSFNLALCKRASFAHENELRALISTDGKGPFATEHGEAIPVDASRLISQVVVSPLAPAWFFMDVAELIRRMGFNFSCVQSDLLRSPAYLTP